MPRSAICSPLSPVAEENIDLPMEKTFEYRYLKAFVLTNGRTVGTQRCLAARQNARFLVFK